MFTNSLNYISEYKTNKLQAIIIGIDFRLYQTLFKTKYHSEIIVNVNDIKVNYNDVFYDGGDMLLTLYVSDDCPIQISPNEDLTITLQISSVHNIKSAYCIYGQKQDYEISVIIGLEHWVKNKSDKTFEIMYEHEKSNKEYLNMIGVLDDGFTYERRFSR